MNFFGIGKLWSWMIVLVGITGILTGGYFLILNKGKEIQKAEVQKTNNQKLDVARQADSKATSTVLTETKVIRENTIEVKEVIKNVPETGLNPISRARLERVRDQQERSGEEPDNSAVGTGELSNGTESP